MQNKRRLILGSLFFALLFFYLGVRVYFAFFYADSYDGWTSKRTDNHAYIVGVDPKGPATALQVNDEFLAINGITLAVDPDIANYYRRVPPGTNYRITVRRNGQALEIPLVTAAQTQSRANFYEKAYVFIHVIFLLTALIVFLLKPEDNQAWLLALMLGSFIGLNTWTMPLEIFGRWLEVIVAIVKILCVWSVLWLLQLFLIFPTRSPILQRWPKLQTYLNWPFYLVFLPFLVGTRLPTFLRLKYFSLPIISWLDAHSWFRLPMPIGIGYLLAALICLVVNYRAADQEARRRLRVVLAGSGIGFLTLVIVILVEYTGTNTRFPNFANTMEFAMLISAPLIPLSFAYAIIRHKVIPISLIIRRGVRYILVTRGAIIFESFLAILCAVLYVKVFFSNWNWRAVALSAAVGIAAWKLIDRLHRRYVAPAIDQRFFRQAYNAQQIMAELADDLRSTTNRHELLELGATKIQAALQTEHVTILLQDEVTKDYRSAYSSSYNGLSSAPEYRLSQTTDIVRRLHESNMPLDVEEAESPDVQSLQASLLLPLKSKDELSGIVALGARRGDLPFSNEDKQLLLSVGAPMSFALENTRLIERLVEDARRREELEAENEQRAKELEEARQLQLSMLPKKVPQLPDMEIAAYMKTATEVGGDYYDFHVSDDGTLTIAVGDATGHGLKAGTMVTATKSLFHELASGNDLPDMLKRFSYALKQMNLRSLFMALTILKIKDNRLTLTVAGMPPILIYRAASKSIEEVFLKALPLGSIAKYNYKQQELALASGDLVVLMSDGFPERFNEASEMLGYESAKTALIKFANLSPQEIITHFVRISDAWGNSRLQDDDVTFVVLKLR